MHRVDGPIGCVGSGGGPEGRIDDAEAYLLAFHIAAALLSARGLIDPNRSELRIAALLGPGANNHGAEKQQAHR